MLSGVNVRGTPYCTQSQTLLNTVKTDMPLANRLIYHSVLCRCKAVRDPFQLSSRFSLLASLALAGLLFLLLDSAKFRLCLTCHASLSRTLLLTPQHAILEKRHSRLSWYDVLQYQTPIPASRPVALRHDRPVQLNPNQGAAPDSWNGGHSLVNKGKVRFVCSLYWWKGYWEVKLTHWLW